jgi:hypothetical protein
MKSVKANKADLVDWSAAAEKNGLKGLRGAGLAQQAQRSASAGAVLFNE